MSVTRNLFRRLSDAVMTMECGDTIVLFDTEDYPIISQRQWSIGTHGYVTSGAGKNQVLMHRLIMNLDDPNLMIDHINRVKIDNRKCNLRICHTFENAKNRTAQANSKTGIKGVCKTADGHFQAQIVINGKAVYLGLYNSEADAASAYDIAHTISAGKFACPNSRSIELRPDVINTILSIKRRRRLSEEDRNRILELNARGLSCREICKKVGFSRSTIRRFLNGETYTEASDA